MTPWLSIACRSLFRNRRRSLSTLLAVAIGFAGLSLFCGFVDYIFEGLRDLQVHGRGGGHLTILREGYGQAGGGDAESHFSGPELEGVLAVLAAEPEALVVAPGMLVAGLMSNGDVSSVCYGYAVSPTEIARMRELARGTLGEFKYFEGRALSAAHPSGIGVSRGLMRRLALRLGDTVVLAGPTADGQFNAVDAEVVQVFEASGDQADRLFMIPVEHARRLRDAGGAGHVGVLLRDAAHAEAVRVRLRQRLAAAGCPVEIRTWEEMSEFYRRVRDMFDVISRFIFVIVLVIAMMSVVNTIGMAVLERTREIGILRALGMKPRGVRLLFVIESALLGAGGSLLGLGLTLAGWAAVRLAAPTWTPPQINVTVPLQVHLVPGYMLMCGAGMLALSVIAALVASRRAAAMEVVDALGHV